MRKWENARHKKSPSIPPFMKGGNPCDQTNKGRAVVGPAFRFRLNFGVSRLPLRPPYWTVIVWVAVVPLLSLTVMVAVPFAFGVIWNCVALTWVRVSWLPETVAV